MIEALRGPLLVAGDALLALGLVVATIAVASVSRERSTFRALHGLALAAAGVALVLLAGLTSGDATMAVRSALTLFVLLATAPVSTHVIGVAEQSERERERERRGGSERERRGGPERERQGDDSGCASPRRPGASCRR